MPTTYTPLLDLNLPEVGASRDVWGTLLNENFTTLDQFVSQSAPIGMLADFAGANAPSGWLIADGRAISRTTYSALFAAIGTYWGAGDGTSTFALPNLIGRSSVGPGNMVDQNGQGYSYSFAQSIGSVQYHILQQHLPNYALTTDAQGYHVHGNYTSAETANHTHYTDAQGSHSHGGQTAYMNVDHTHTGYTDTQGAHSHNVTTPNTASAAAGSYPVDYPSSGFNYHGAVTDTQGSHSHNVQTYGSSASHLHAISVDGNHAHNLTTESASHQHQIYGDGTHSHTIYLGGSSAWFPVLQPVIVVTKIIYAGTQAATVMAAAQDVAPSVMERDESDELALIREELAALRAILAPPGRPRPISAPMRGVH